MATSEVDLKVLSKSAAAIDYDDPFLSAMLYRVLGLSMMLSGKLTLQQQRNHHHHQRQRLDQVRDARSHQRIRHHVLWLSREGLAILEQYVLPMVDKYVELSVLAYKLRCSFYHLFVLFCNEPPVQHSHQHSHRHQDPRTYNNNNDNDNNNNNDGKRSSRGASSSTTATPAASSSRHARHHPPPGLQQQQQQQPPPQQNPTMIIKHSFILPAMDYIPTAMACFKQASRIADRLLPGSHPLRLSVKLEYAAFLHDCVHDVNASRRVAKRAVVDVYQAQNGMDDESFEDAAEIVGILGKMIKRKPIEE